MAEFKKENFPGNQIKKNPEEPKVISKVIKGSITTRKEPLLYRIFGGGTAHEIGNYVIWDILVPAAKSTISDIITNSLDMIFYGEEGRSRKVKRDRDRSYVSYNSIYDTGRHSPVRRKERSRTHRHRFDDIILTHRSDAEEVLSTLVELVDQYELATVADFYDAVGLQSEYTDSKYGWEDLREAYIRQVRGGYILILPSPSVIS